MKKFLIVLYFFEQLILFILSMLSIYAANMTLSVDYILLATSFWVIITLNKIWFAIQMKGAIN